MDKVLTLVVLTFSLMVGQAWPSHDDQREGRQLAGKRWQQLEARLYVRKIFERYGHQGALSYEGFEHLLEDLGLGNIAIEGHGVDDHKVTDGFRSLHDNHDHGLAMGGGSRDDDDDDDDDDDGGDGEDSYSDDDGDEADSSRDSHHDAGDVHHRYHHRRQEGERRSTSTGGATSDENRLVRRSVPEEHHVHDHENIDDKCLSPEEILDIYRLKANTTISVVSFIHLCPAILYQIEHHACHVTHHRGADDGSRDLTLKHFEFFHGDVVDGDRQHIDEHGHEHDDGEEGEAHDHEHGHVHYHHHHHHHHDDAFLGNDTTATLVRRSFLDIPGKVWGYAILAVTVISLVGLVCVAVVPIMNRMTYDYLVQFLVALAVGTLTGDALLHLIPHSLVAHSHEEGEEEDEGHDEAIYKGCVVLGGIYLFFITERIMAIVTDMRKQKQNKKQTEKSTDIWTEMKVYDGVNSDIGEKLSRHSERINSCQNFTREYPSQIAGQVIPEENAEELKKLREYDDYHNDAVTVVINKHDDDDRDESHSGHGHSHSHEAPKSISSIAWMVIMGDGLHNFTDGLAIGAGFGASITVGLSTSIAVFCHELPHELGDFAVLLKAGMSVKLALFYNIVSSVLCFVGLVIGVAVGNISSAGSWIFSLTAGIFLYISLVDMLPEISIAEHLKSKRRCCHLLLQILGISTGVAIMLVIALFESDIKVG